MSDKIGILSAIHGTYDALKAILDTAKKKKISKILASSFPTKECM